MGGVFFTHGNIDKMAEANFFVDPHAADFVLQQKVKKILIPLDVTRKTIFTPEQKDSLPNTKISKLVKSIVKTYQDFYIANTSFLGCALHDPLAMGVAIDSSFVKTRFLDVRVETNGKYTRGVCVPELREREKYPNIHVALEVESEKFLNYFLKTLSN
jgi:purine nucleosidase